MDLQRRFRHWRPHEYDCETPVDLSESFLFPKPPDDPVFANHIVKWHREFDDSPHIKSLKDKHTRAGPGPFARSATVSSQAPSPAPSRSERLDSNPVPIPRFLFRGYNVRSGGPDPRLNQTRDEEQGDVIVPHYFLHPTDVFRIERPTKRARDMDNMAEVVSGHLTTRRDIVSYFSSWTQSLMTAIHFAGDWEERWIAILDTTLLKPFNEAFHTAQLKTEGYFDQKDYPHEYLIYGAIAGDAIWSVRGFQIDLLWTPPLHLSMDGIKAARDIAWCKDVASIFIAPQFKDRDESADVVIHLTVILICSFRYIGDYSRASALDMWGPEFELVGNVLKPELDHRIERLRRGEDVVSFIGSSFNWIGRAYVGLDWFSMALNTLNKFEEQEKSQIL